MNRPYEVSSKTRVILSDRRESKNLRTEGQQCKNDSAKILRRGVVLLRMTEVVGNWQLSIINYQLSIVNFGAPVWGRQIRKKYLPFLGRGEKCRRGAAFRDFQKMKMGKKWEDFFAKVWYNSIVRSGDGQLTITSCKL